MRTEEIVATPFGMMRLLSDGSGILALEFIWKKGPAPGTSKKSPLAKQVVKELMEFEKGARKRFDLKVSPSVKGTDFQKRVWKIVSSIPYGKTLTYKEVAVRLGNPYLARAVGQAMRANRVPIVIPCHRVVATGGLGGYSGREHLDVKTRLLGIEKKIR